MKGEVDAGRRERSFTLRSLPFTHCQRLTGLTLLLGGGACRVGLRGGWKRDEGQDSQQAGLRW